MRAKCTMRVAILALWAMPDAIGQYRLEPIEVRTHSIEALVDYNTRKILPHAAPHHARLAVLYFESLFQKDRCNLRGKPLYAFHESLVT